MCNKLKLINFAVFLASAIYWTGCTPKPECFDCNDYTQKEMFSPPNFKGTVVNGTSISYEWGAVSGAKYELELYATRNNTTGELSNQVGTSVVVDSIVDEIKGTVATKYVFTDLLPAKYYYARIKSIHVKDKIPEPKWAVAAAVLTQSENLLAGRLLFGYDFMVATWKWHKNAFGLSLNNSQQLYLITADDYIITDEGVKIGYKQFCGLKSDTEYNLQLYTALGIVDGAVETYVRGNETGKTLKESILSADAVDLNQVKLIWNYSDYYTLQHCTPLPLADRIEYKQGNSVVSVPLNATDREKVITGLTPETTYDFKIYAGDNLRGTVTVRTLTDYSAKVFLTPSAGDIQDFSVLLKWQAAVNDVTKIIVSSTISGDKDVTVDLSASDISAHQKKIEGLKNYTTYQFRIFNNDFFRDEIILTTLENIFLPANNPTAVAGVGEVTLKWDNSRLAADRIVASAAGKTDVTVTLSSTETEKTITGLYPETDYTFRIYTGVDLRGTVTAKTLKTTP